MQRTGAGRGAGPGEGGGCGLLGWRERGKEVGDQDSEDALKVGPSSRVEPVFLPGDGSFGLCSGCEVGKRAMKEKIVNFLVVIPHLGK